MPKPIRQIRIEGNIAYVPLTRGYEAIIDVSDVSLIDNFNWCVQKSARSVYAVRSERRNGKQRTIFMHRVIMGEPDGLQVDHEDGNGLNNRRKNLRRATVSQNQQNSRVRLNNKTGFKGVTYHKQNDRYRATIKAHGKQVSLGCYSTPEEAHLAYQKASIKYYGRFGRA